MRSERASSELNTVVSPGLKLEFVLQTMQLIKYTDPDSVKYIVGQITEARSIMTREMKKCIEAGIDPQYAAKEAVDAIIDELFVRFVCQSPS